MQVLLDLVRPGPCWARSSYWGLILSLQDLLRPSGSIFRVIWCCWCWIHYLLNVLSLLMLSVIIYKLCVFDFHYVLSAVSLCLIISMITHRHAIKDCFSCRCSLTFFGQAHVERVAPIEADCFRVEAYYYPWGLRVASCKGFNIIVKIVIIIVMYY